MFNISSFLEKFSKSIHSVEINKKTIVEIIEKHTQLKLSIEDLEIKNYIIFVRSSPAIKNKLFIYKKVIIEDISNLMSEKIVDIK